MAGRSTCLFTLCMTLVAVTALPVQAFREGAPAGRHSLTVMSARSSGMGMVSVVLDEGSVGTWWNPGMAALDRNAGLDFTSSDLAEGIADDINMKTFTLFSGRLPAGPLEIADSPVEMVFGLGRGKLDFGTSEAITEGGATTVEFESYDLLYNFLLGLSWRGMIGGGMTLEYTKAHVADAIPEAGSEEYEATAWGASFGIALQPTFRFDGDEGFTPLRENVWSEERPPGASIAPVLGWSYLHKGQDFDYGSDIRPEEQAKQTRLGYGGKIRLDAGTTGEAFDWHRLLSVEFLIGRETAASKVKATETVAKTGATDDRNKDIDLDGWELRVGGIFSLRRGNVDDPNGNIDGGTEGWGVGVEGYYPVGFRYDEAEVPQPSGLPDVTRKEFMVSADLMRLIALVRD